MTVSLNYMQAIGTGFPTVGCHCLGDGSIYENIVWDNGGSVPTQSDLDIWIANYIKLEMTTLILAERYRRTSTGGYQVGTYWFHSDDTSRVQQIALVIMGSNMPANIMWKTMSGEFVLMTPTLANQIFQSASSSDIGIFNVAEQKKTTMLASSDPGSYDYLSGWPLVYGE